MGQPRKRHRGGLCRRGGPKWKPGPLDPHHPGGGPLGGHFYGGWRAGAPHWVGAWVRGRGGVCLTVSARAGWEQAIVCGTAGADWQWLEGWIVLPPDATQFHLLIRTGLGEVWIDEVRIGPPLTPWRIERWDREVSGCSGCVQPTFAFYNGLGWKLQERVEKEDAATQVVRNWVYDALGRVVREDLPVEEPFTWDFVRPTGWENRPHTRTTYDALGRPLAVTAPDGAVTRYAYADGGVLALDPNGHQTLKCTDGLGRLAEVYAFRGTFASPTLSAEPLAVARYRSNAQDRLTDVRDPLGPGPSGEPDPHRLRPPGPQGADGRPGHGRLVLPL